MVAKTSREQAERDNRRSGHDEPATEHLQKTRDQAPSDGELLRVNFASVTRAVEAARAETQMARQEARSDLQRSRHELIQLIEQVRSERADLYHDPGSPPGASTEAATERLDAIERRVERVEATLSRCFERQNELAATMEALLDTVLRERRGEPVSGLRLT